MSALLRFRLFFSFFLSDCLLSKAKRRFDCPSVALVNGTPCIFVALVDEGNRRPLYRLLSSTKEAGDISLLVAPGDEASRRHVYPAVL